MRKKIDLWIYFPVFHSPEKFEPDFSFTVDENTNQIKRILRLNKDYMVQSVTHNVGSIHLGDRKTIKFLNNKLEENPFRDIPSITEAPMVFANLWVENKFKIGIVIKSRYFEITPKPMCIFDLLEEQQAKDKLEYLKKL